MNIYEKLAAVQSELNAPKKQYNSFGKYNYRSQEDILEAAKPLCIAHGLILTLSDQIIQVGDRYYVEATATVTEIETGEKHSGVASAREGENKKGMDDAQLTGATSSYARKYALNGLFSIDDNKDPDTDAYRNQQDNAPAKSQKQNKLSQTAPQASQTDSNQQQALDQGSPAKVSVKDLVSAYMAKFNKEEPAANADLVATYNKYAEKNDKKKVKEVKFIPQEMKQAYYKMCQ